MRMLLQNAPRRQDKGNRHAGRRRKTLEQSGETAKVVEIPKGSEKMNESMYQSSGASEAVWCAWLEKGKQRDRATARRMRALAGIVLVFLAIAFVFYVLA